MIEEPRSLQLHRQAIAAHEQDDPKTALRLLNEAVDIDPMDAALHNSLGAIYRAVGAYGPAIAHFQEAIALNPTFEMPRNNLKRAFEISGETVHEHAYDTRYRGRRLPDSPKILVISHERSGSHFLINTIAFNFGYGSQCIDVRTDLIAGRPDPAPHLASFKGRTISNVFKSHHARPLFGDSFDGLLDDFKVFYIVRDPRDVMTSYWRFAGQALLDEGPRAESVDVFSRMRPTGRAMFYEHPASADMITRWRRHVDGWQPEVDAGNVYLLRYEDLLGDFEDTLDRISGYLDAKPLHCFQPDIKLPSIAPWHGVVGSWRERMTPDGEAYVKGIAGPLMGRFGYD